MLLSWHSYIRGAMCALLPPQLQRLLFVPLKHFLEVVGEMMDESHYLLFVILAVHVQHKQVIAQAADGDACNRERPFDTQRNSTGILARVSEPLPGTQQLLFPHQETRQLRSCMAAPQ